MLTLMHLIRLMQMQGFIIRLSEPICVEVWLFSHVLHSIHCDPMMAYGSVVVVFISHYNGLSPNWSHMLTWTNVDLLIMMRSGTTVVQTKRSIWKCLLHNDRWFFCKAPPTIFTLLSACSTQICSETPIIFHITWVVSKQSNLEAQPFTSLII